MPPSPHTRHIPRPCHPLSLQAMRTKQFDMKRKLKKTMTSTITRNQTMLLLVTRL